MTIKQLIEELQKYDPELGVICNDPAIYQHVTGLQLVEPESWEWYNEYHQKDGVFLRIF